MSLITRLARAGIFIEEIVQPDLGELVHKVQI